MSNTTFFDDYVRRALRGDTDKAVTNPLAFTHTAHRIAGEARRYDLYMRIQMVAEKYNLTRRAR